MALPWTRALVTGASAGIGRECARLLARHGVDVVLVARRRDRLTALATELAGYGARAEVLPADLTDAAQRAAVAARLATEPAIDLLVNNAGSGMYGRFDGLPPEALTAELTLNTLAPMELTRAALPGMVGRGRGWVLNVASLAGLQPTPRMATYAAAKGALADLSRALAVELHGTGVTVTVALPGLTRSEFQETSGVTWPDVPDYLWQDAAPCAQEILTGCARGRDVVVAGGWRNRLAAAGTQIVPTGLARWVASVATANAQRTRAD